LELREKVQKPLRQNQLKKIKMSMEKLLNEHGMSETVKRYELYLLEKNAYEGAKSSLEHLKSCDKDLLLCCLKDLEQRGYIADNALLEKGHIASCINGYDKIVLTELITSSYVNELSVCELGVLLAFFIKFSGNVELYEIEHIAYLYDYLVSMDATVYTSFAPLVYQWLNDIAYGAIDGVDSYSEGNFITQMNLLVQLVDNLISVCEDYEFHVLMKKLSELRVLLRRDIVITQSLHL
jgi:superfamily II RNA helicase